MTKRYTILRKKLHELEFEINHALSILPENQTIHQNLSEDITQKLCFIANLLNAEIASRPTKPHHLKHIEQRLTQLEAAFHDWETSTTQHNTLPDHVDNDDASVCSCTESCLNDDGEAASIGLGFSDIEDPEKTCVECLEEEKSTDQMEFYDCVVVDEKKGVVVEEERRVYVGVGKLCGAMVSGIVMGMAFMGFVSINFCFSGFLQVEQWGNSIPPT